MLAGFSRLDRHRYMQVVRQRVVDSFDLGVRQQLFVRAVRLGDAQLLGRLLGFRQIARGDGLDVAKLALLHRPNHAVQANLGGADDSPFDFLHGCLLEES